MSVLNYLQRLASWGNLYRNQPNEYSSRSKTQDLLSYQMQLEKEISRNFDQRGTQRKKISYWSDDDRLSYKR